MMDALELFAVIAIPLVVVLGWPPLLNWIYRRQADIKYRRRRAIIAHLQGGPLAGRELRDLLSARGMGLSDVRFYALMAELERDSIEGWYGQMTVSGQPTKERWYRLKGITTMRVKGGVIVDP